MLLRFYVIVFGRLRPGSRYNGVPGLGGYVAEFVKFALRDGSEVFFESAESDLFASHAGDVDLTDGGPLQARLASVADAASEVAESLRSRVTPHELTMEFGLKVSGEVNWWFFAKNRAEGTINVKLTWHRRDDGQSHP